MHYKETKFGFEYGNAKITRLCSDKKKGWVVLQIKSDKYQECDAVQIYITKTGKIRIHSQDGEWLPKNSKQNIKNDIINA